MLWANLHLLFWLSLIPFVTGWMGENHFATLPDALYGVVLLDVRPGLLPAVACPDRARRCAFGAGPGHGQGPQSILSLLLYLVAIALAAFFHRPTAMGVYVLVAVNLVHPRPPH